MFSYPFQSAYAFFSIFLPSCWFVPMAIGILTSIGVVLPFSLVFYILGDKNPPTKKRYWLCALSTPFIAVIGSLIFSIVLPFAAISTHWLRADDVIKASNGPAYYMFCTLGLGTFPLPSYVTQTPETPKDLMRCHIAYVYLDDREQGYFVQKAYPKIYEHLKSIRETEKK
jgi:peptidoglycan biosynthesis protein MviN/MurJ (putative lipid II flippase)